MAMFRISAAARPEFEIREPHIGQDAQDLHAFDGHEEIAVPEHRRIERPFINGGARRLVEPQETVSFRLARPPQLRRGRREVAAQQRDSIDDGMQVDDDLAADPIDVVATFAARWDSLTYSHAATDRPQLKLDRPSPPGHHDGDIREIACPPHLVVKHQSGRVAHRSP